MHEIHVKEKKKNETDKSINSCKKDPIEKEKDHNGQRKTTLIGFVLCILWRRYNNYSLLNFF